MSKNQVQDLREKARDLLKLSEQEYNQRRAEALRDLRFDTQRKKAMLRG